jgi:hypothetical protein
MSAGMVTGPNRHRDFTPTISLTPYSVNDQVGGLLEITGLGDNPLASVTLQSIVVNDRTTQAATLEFFFFDRDPDETSTDNSTLSIPDASTPYKVGDATVQSAAYKVLSLNCGATLNNIGLKMPTNSSGTIFCLIRTTSTPTYSSTSDLSLRFAFFVDGNQN